MREYREEKPLLPFSCILWTYRSKSISSTDSFCTSFELVSPWFCNSICGELRSFLFIDRFLRLNRIRIISSRIKIIAARLDPAAADTFTLPDPLLSAGTSNADVAVGGWADTGEEIDFGKVGVGRIDVVKVEFSKVNVDFDSDVKGEYVFVVRVDPGFNAKGDVDIEDIIELKVDDDNVGDEYRSV
jgi:hypothetical protein